MIFNGGNARLMDARKVMTKQISGLTSQMPTRLNFMSRNGHSTAGLSSILMVRYWTYQAVFIRPKHTMAPNGTEL